MRYKIKCSKIQYANLIFNMISNRSLLHNFLSNALGLKHFSWCSKSDFIDVSGAFHLLTSS